MPCPSNCTPDVLIGNPQGICSQDVRQRILSRIAFFPCNTTLPDPITGPGMKALFDSGEIVASSKLANIVLADPQTEDVVIDECSVARKFITSRLITAEDRISVSLTSGSPATTNKFRDYDFWQDKLDHQLLMYTMLIYCDGDVIIPATRDGVYISASLTAYLNYQKPSTQGGQWIEFKHLEFNYPGDPLALFLKPAFNYITAGITL